jgi:hypothetical protein
VGKYNSRVGVRLSPLGKMDNFGPIVPTSG